VPGRAPSVVSDGVFGGFERRAGTNASLSLFTGEVPRLAAATSMVWAFRGVGGSSEAVVEPVMLISDCAAESRVSELIRGEERVR
jgi:hypothetical protein